MSNIHADPQKTVPGFWTGLALAIEAMSESYEEQLEKRVSRLEAEVGRLSAILKNLREPEAQAPCCAVREIAQQGPESR